MAVHGTDRLPSREATGIRWRDIDLAAGTTTITNTRVIAGGSLVEGSTQVSHGARTIALDADLVAMLRSLRSAQRLEYVALGLRPTPTTSSPARTVVRTGRNGSPPASARSPTSWDHPDRATRASPHLGHVGHRLRAEPQAGCPAARARLLGLHHRPLFPRTARPVQGRGGRLRGGPPPGRSNRDEDCCCHGCCHGSTAHPLTWGQGLRVRPLGFEPRTCGLRVRCSAIELEAPDASELLLRGSDAKQRARPVSRPRGASAQWRHG